MPNAIITDAMIILLKFDARKAVKSLKLCVTARFADSTASPFKIVPIRVTKFLTTGRNASINGVNVIESTNLSKSAKITKIINLYKERYKCHEESCNYDGQRQRPQGC